MAQRAGFAKNDGVPWLDGNGSATSWGDRGIICAAISQYKSTSAVQGPKNYLQDGRMKGKEDVVVGQHQFPNALLKLFSGENFGKLVLDVAR